MTMGSSEWLAALPPARGVIIEYQYKKNKNKKNKKNHSVSLIHKIGRLGAGLFTPPPKTLQPEF
jgi:hypothetical protein